MRGIVEFENDTSSGRTMLSKLDNSSILGTETVKQPRNLRLVGLQARDRAQIQLASFNMLSKLAPFKNLIWTDVPGQEGRSARLRMPPPSIFGSARRFVAV